MLGDVRGRRVVDLGCGEGAYARALAKRGARVTAVDGSTRLVEVARQRARAEHLDIDHFCANANALDTIPSTSVDVVLASMVLMDVEDYEGAAREIHRILAPHGELVMSITHPCFSAPTSEWVRDAAGNPQFFAVDRYFDRVAWEDLIARGFRAPVIRRHRPLQDYLTPLLGLGLVLRDFQEPSVTEEELRHSPRFAYLRRVPYFVFMRWEKS
jgi:ubiquinone/menaquinone biosynthesis C-methylase UbiE